MDMDALTLSVTASLPEIIIIVGACVLLMFASGRGKHNGPLFFWSSLATVAAAAIATFWLAGEPRLVYSGMFMVDDFSIFFKGVFYLAAGLCILISPRYLEKENIARGEYYVLLLFALTGMMIMASGMDLLSIYVGMELQALCIYVLTGFTRHETRSNEAALKYVILGSVSSGIFLYGLSLVYGITGTTQLADMTAALASGGTSDPALLLATVFLITGLIFKVGAVPLHMWVPDVYEGAPTTITAFMSVGPKAAAFAILLRIFLDAMAPVAEIWVVVVAVLAVLTMALGSFVAIVQTNIKRMLAYSSIAHAGFVLLGLVAGGPDGAAGVMLYLLIYVFMNIGIFAIIIIMQSDTGGGEAIGDYAGLAKSHRGLALLMLIFLFSLASIPPTAGFFAKFYILTALVDQGYVGLAVIAVLLSAVAAFFYIRIIMLMYMKEEARPFNLTLTPPLRTAIAISAAGTVGIGLLPAWFLSLAQGSVLPGIN